MRNWDIFCTVVDNYGDIGVCWRLARQLAKERGFKVRLWVDDLPRLARLAPDIAPGLDAQMKLGVEVRRWTEPFAAVEPADIVVEAFACDPPAIYVAAMAERRVKPLWINLEYLSAEAWVKGCHGLPSPHPRLPLIKHFFFPGFEPGTGGLIAEAGLIAERERFQGSASARADLWRRLGVAEPRSGELQVSLFCYPQAAVAGLFAAWAAGAAPVRCLVPEGTAESALRAYFECEGLPNGAVFRSGNLELRRIVFVDQECYDRLLWSCDLNVVRGEDSFVRAQWAARPLLWQIYPQEAGAHWPKLEAFLDLYCKGLMPEIADVVRRFWLAWNQGDAAAIAAIWPDYSRALGSLNAHARCWSEDLIGLGDLANNLANFAENLLK